MLTQYAALLVKQLQTLQGEQNSKRVGALQMGMSCSGLADEQPQSTSSVVLSSQRSTGLQMLSVGDCHPIV